MALDLIAPQAARSDGDRSRLGAEIDMANPEMVRKVFSAQHADASISRGDGGIAAQASSGLGSYIQQFYNYLKARYYELSGSCPSSPVYDQLIDKAARNIYDPKSLGNIKTLKSKYNCQIHSTEDAIKYADEALTTAGDPYTDIHPPAEVAELKRAMEGSYAGVGIEFGPPKKEAISPLVAERLVPGAPAEAAGVKPGDAVIKVDGKDIRSMNMAEASNLVRGPENTQVTLTVQRGSETLDLHITRAKIELPEVTDKTLPDGLAYIKVNSFMQDDAELELAQAIDKHENAKGLIIDMRGNPGGRVDKALQMTSLFLKEGKIMTMRERVDSDPSNPQYMTVEFALNKDSIKLESRLAGKTQTERVDRMPDIVDKPVVILIDSHTASAAEIFTSALQDNHDATVVGTQSFGKGVAQSIFKNMPGGTWLQVTGARYYTANGKWLGDGNNTKIGITPDVVVENPKDAKPGSDKDEQLNAAIRILKEKTRSHT